MSDHKDKPKHQPSPKHTLEEVLRSLQDLVRNELAEEPPAAPEVKEKPAKEKKPLAQKPAESLKEKPKEKPKKPPPTPATPGPTAGGIQEELPLTVEPPPAANLNWDDIPVLKDVVVAPSLTRGMTPERRKNLDALATRVLAKLNQELRQAGQPPLDPVIIPRLAELLREALEAEIEPPAKS